MTEKEMKKAYEKIVKRVSQKYSPNVLQSENETEELYNETKVALVEIIKIGDNPDNKNYNSQINTVRRFFEKAIKAYVEKDFHSFKHKTGLAIDELWKIINSLEEIF